MEVATEERKTQLERAIAGIKRELAEPGISAAYRDALERQLAFFEVKLAELGQDA